MGDAESWDLDEEQVLIDMEVLMSRAALARARARAARDEGAIRRWMARQQYAFALYASARALVLRRRMDARPVFLLGPPQPRHTLYAVGETPVVLLVDDHADSVQGYDEYLALCGLRMESASTGEQALGRLNELAPDVVVMDIGLPGLTGWEAVEKIRSHASTAEIPIIAFSGYAEATDRQRAEDLGCDAFLAKPCPPAKLAAAIGRVLARRWGGDVAAKSEHARLVDRTRGLVEGLARGSADPARHCAELGRALAELKALASQA
jgi:two-component system, cell cycle response regulator DivK